jgi:hypothetical protein
MPARYGEQLPPRQVSLDVAQSLHAAPPVPHCASVVPV